MTVRTVTTPHHKNQVCDAPSEQEADEGDEQELEEGEAVALRLGHRGHLGAIPTTIVLLGLA